MGSLEIDGIVDIFQAEKIKHDTQCREDLLRYYKEEVVIETLSKTHDKVVLKLLNCDAVVANVLRRAMMSMIDVMAFEIAHVHLNSGPLHDEILCQRFGLVPLRINSKNYTKRKSHAEAIAPIILYDSIS